MTEDPRIAVLPDIHGHAKGEHKPFSEERPIPYTARMLFLWFYHACRRGSPRFLMVADHMNYLTFEDPAAVNLVRRALKLAQAGDLYGAAETAGVELGHAAAVSEGLRKGMRYSIGAEVDNDPRSRPDAQNIVDAMRPDGMIRSVHFLSITHPQHGENWMWAFDNPEFKDLYELVGPERVWELYITTLIEAIEKLPGQIVGHFYVPAKFGHWPDDAVLQGYEDRLLDACAERGMAVEVNSRYIYKYFVDDEAQLAKFRAVHLRLMRKAKRKGVTIAVGSDAHSPKDQGADFDQILALLDEADINEIAFPINGRIARVALRATEEILRQQAAAAAPPPLPPPPPRVEPVAEPAPVIVPKRAKATPAKAAPAAEAAAASAKAATKPAAAPRTPKAPKPGPPAPGREPIPVLRAAATGSAKLSPKPAGPKPEPKPDAKIVAKAPPKAAKAPKASEAAKPGKKIAEKPKPPARKPAAKVARPAKKAAVRPARAAKAAPKRAASAKKTKTTKAVAKRPAAKRAAAKKTAARPKTVLRPKTVAGKKAAKKAAPARNAAKRSAAPKRAGAQKKVASKKAAPKKKRSGSRR
jgi:HisJ family histidinol phosphate phosphatase